MQQVFVGDSNMTREEIIALAKASLKKDVIYHRDGIELEWDDLIDFFHEAQRQAYERAAEECENQKVGIASYFEIDERIQWCADTIRALIEGETNV